MAEDKIPAEDGGKDQKEEAKTWAGRWIPEEGLARTKMMAIRKVYEQCIARKIRSQSTFQNQFFVRCGRAFKNAGIADNEDTTVSDFQAAAEGEVAEFLQLEAVRA